MIIPLVITDALSAFRPIEEWVIEESYSNLRHCISTERDEIRYEVNWITGEGGLNVELYAESTLKDFDRYEAVIGVFDFPEVPDALRRLERALAIMRVKEGGE